MSTEPAQSGKRKANSPPPENTLARRRVMKELDRHFKANTAKSDAERDLEFELVDESNIMEWRAKLYYANAQDGIRKQLAEQLASCGKTFIELRICFTEEYPGKPPFVFVRSPRLMGGYVFENGAICSEALSEKYGWSPANTTESLIIAVRALIESNGVALANTGSSAAAELPNEEKAAREDAKRIARAHREGWGGYVPRS
jgi:ubiquitin-protein ligase